MKPKIALISDVKNWGGYERATYIKKYLSDEFDFELFDGDEFKEFEWKTNSYFIKWDELNNYRLSGKSGWPKNVVCLPQVLDMINKRKEGDRKFHLYYLMFHTMLTWWEVKRMMFEGQKFISVVTGQPVVKEVFANEKHFSNPTVAFQALANMCPAIFANNMLSLNELKKLYGGATFYTPRGVDPEVFYTEEEMKVNDIKENLTATFVGKDRSGKGLNRFIKPACDRTPGGVKLHINERNYTNAKSKDQMRKLYNSAHVHIVASNTDGTPNPALEAAACGRPIITNRIGNMPEFIEDGYNGFIVDRKVEAYIEKLNWMKQNPEKVIEMGKNAQKTVLESWTWEHITHWERIALRKVLGIDRG